MAHHGDLDVSQYDSMWPATFEQIRADVEPLLAEIGAVVEHVGSTAIPQMVAKPILDIDVVAPTVADVAELIDLLERRGYRHKGNRGIAGREMLDPPADLPFRHAYVVVNASPPHLDHTLFRDHLIEHADVAADYAELKLTLAPLLKFDRQMYTDAKTAFVADILETARRNAGIPVDEGHVVDGVRYRWRAPIDPDRIDALVGNAFDGVPRVDWWKRARPRSLGWVTAHCDDELAGFVNVIADGGVHAVILDTAVAERFRRRSIGEHLVRIAAEHARDSGCAWLHVDFEPHLRGLYFDACGFSPTEAGLIALR